MSDKTIAYYVVVFLFTVAATWMVWKIFTWRAWGWRTSPLLIGVALAILPSAGAGPTESWLGIFFVPIGAFAILMVAIMVWMWRIAARQMRR